MARTNRDWVKRLNGEEQAALKASEDFFRRPSSRFQKVVSKVSRPLDKVLKASPESFQKSITNAIHSVLKTVAEGAEAGFSEQELVDQLCGRLGLELNPWDRIFHSDFRTLDEIVVKRIRASKKLAIVQGGVTGLTGLPGLLADIPSLYFLLFRTVNQVATCFGHPAHSPTERRYLLQVVNVGHHLEEHDLRCAFGELEEIENQLEDKTGSTEDLQRALLAKTIQLLARKLTATILHRKAAQTVALVGGAVGAVINRQLTEDVSLTARHAYRRRFLKQAALSR